MGSKTVEDDHKIILHHFGKDAVLLKLAEEAAELSAAICRLNVAEKNDNTANHGDAYQEVLEEFADVLEVSERVKPFVDMGFVCDIMHRKRQRTLWRIESEKSGHRYNETWDQR